MSQTVKGNTRSLPPSLIKKVHRLFSRQVDNSEIVSPELAREIYRLAEELGRRIGVLLSREGQVEEVFIGQKNILYIPDLGRYRLGKGRLRRLRLIFSDLSRPGEDPQIPTDIYTDLEKLRLDMVVAVKEVKNRTTASYAHLTATNAGKGRSNIHTAIISDLSRDEFDFSEFLVGLESELSEVNPNGIPKGEIPAVLVGVSNRSAKEAGDSMAELGELARTAGIYVVDQVIQRRQPDPRTFLGKGKIEEIVLHCLGLGAEMIIFDSELRPSQWRALTNATELKVIDRSMLILDIFAQRATSSDGRLQVELAQLKYNLPRLVEMDAGLSRLTGGIGGRGPGETKLEIGRRRARDRISALERRIEQLSAQRELRRKQRRESQMPLVSILGYTNVGKSTLFNALTRSSVLVENKLFATLDPAQRRLVIPYSHPSSGYQEVSVILSDTVGFIRDLPVELRTAFRATLEELNYADLLLEVLDASDPNIADHKAAVDGILQEMAVSNTPRLIVLNKTDKVSEEERQALARGFEGVAVSALSGEGLEQLREKIAAHFSENKAETISA